MRAQLALTAPPAAIEREASHGSGSSVLPAVVDIEAGKSAKGMHMPESWRRSPSSGSAAGLQVAFQGLNFTVQSNTDKSKQLTLLNDVSGYFEPYEMAALMGPSGSGKTTLLDLLAGRKTVGKLTGTLKFGGQSPSPAFLRRYSSYIEQFDTLLGTLTVEEMLMYTAELKRPINEPTASKRAAVDVLLNKLALNTCRNVPIGDPLSKGISGGQAKRTNIGIGLVSNPRVLFLDEPTSGLDSYTSNEVMKVVKALTAEGTTICATIHSPTAACFALFDRVLMLARGQVIYFGPQGLEAAQFALAAWPGVVAPGANSNDAEWLVNIITEADNRGDSTTLADAYKRSALKQDNDRMIESIITGRSASNISEDVAKELAVKSSTEVPWWWAFLTYMKYRTYKNYQNSGWLGPRIADKLLVALIMLTLYLNIGGDMSRDNLINIQSALFMWALMPAFGASSYVPAIVLERPLFLRERADGLYHVGTYLLCKLVEEIFLAIFLTLILASFVFKGIGFQGEFSTFWLVYFIDLSTGIVLAYLIAAISPNMDVANAALPAYVVTLLFFAGQLCTFDSIPRWWQWYSRIDFLRYAWSALMVNQFQDNDAFFTESTSILNYYSLAGEDKWAQVGYQSLFFPVFVMLSYLALSYVRHQKR